MEKKLKKDWTIVIMIIAFALLASFLFRQNTINSNVIKEQESIIDSNAEMAITGYLEASYYKEVLNIISEDKPITGLTIRVEEGLKEGIGLDGEEYLQLKESYPIIDEYLKETNATEQELIEEENAKYTVTNEYGNTYYVKPAVNLEGINMGGIPEMPDITIPEIPNFNSQSSLRNMPRIPNF